MKLMLQAVNDTHFDHYLSVCL